MSSPKQSVARTKREARNERRRDQTRAEILDTARDVVLGSGLARFTLSAVADELGLTKPALYYYFDSKEALLFELLLREWVESATEVQAAVIVIVWNSSCSFSRWAPAAISRGSSAMRNSSAFARSTTCCTGAPKLVFALTSEPEAFQRSVTRAGSPSPLIWPSSDFST